METRGPAAASTPRLKVTWQSAHAGVVLMVAVQGGADATIPKKSVQNGANKGKSSRLHGKKQAGTGLDRITLFEEASDSMDD